MFQFNRYGTVEINNEQRISSFLEKKKYCEHGFNKWRNILFTQKII